MKAPQQRTLNLGNPHVIDAVSPHLRLVFVDRVCISEHDPQLKAEALMSAWVFGESRVWSWDFGLEFGV